jgi:hypothetical protein
LLGAFILDSGQSLKRYSNFLSIIAATIGTPIDKRAMLEGKQTRVGQGDADHGSF